LLLHSLKVTQLLRSAACLHTNQSRSYLNHLVYIYIYNIFTLCKILHCHSQWCTAIALFERFIPLAVAVTYSRHIFTLTSKPAIELNHIIVKEFITKIVRVLCWKLKLSPAWDRQRKWREVQNKYGVSGSYWSYEVLYEIDASYFFLKCVVRVIIKIAYIINISLTQFRLFFHTISLIIKYFCFHLFLRYSMTVA